MEEHFIQKEKNDLEASGSYFNKIILKNVFRQLPEIGFSLTLMKC